MYMNKSTLKQLGQLHEIKRILHNQAVDSSFQGDPVQKLNLVVKVAKQLEEQKRGFSKSKINYAEMANTIIKHYAEVDYLTLMKLITKVM